jgi:hypothetical protein
MNYKLLCGSVIVIVVLGIILLLIWLSFFTNVFNLTKAELLDTVPDKYKLWHAVYNKKTNEGFTILGNHEFPVIYKPNGGNTSQGVAKIKDQEAADKYVAEAKFDEIIIQQFHPGPLEFTIQCHTEDYQTFDEILKKDPSNMMASRQLPSTDEKGRPHILYYINQRIPSSDDIFKAGKDHSYIYTERSPALLMAIADVCQTVPLFTDIRMDVRAESHDAFLNGEFVVVEINDIFMDASNPRPTLDTLTQWGHWYKRIKNGFKNKHKIKMDKKRRAHYFDNIASVILGK